MPFLYIVARYLPFAVFIEEEHGWNYGVEAGSVRSKHLSCSQFLFHLSR